MRNALMITQARNISVCLKSYMDLPIDKVWFTGYTEAQLAPVMNRFITQTDYDNYLIVSDDLIANRKSFDLITKELESREVVSGWCKQAPWSKFTNVRFKKWRGLSLFSLLMTTRYAGRYGFATFDEVMASPPIFRTYFTGGCLTGMRRKIWLNHPFKPMHKNGGSDYMQCKELNQAGIAIWCIRDAYMEHLKSRANWLVGKVVPNTKLEIKTVA